MTKSLKCHFSMRSVNLIRNRCKPLAKFDVVGFTHDITFPHGELSMLTTHEDVFKLWFNQRLPAVCTNESGRTLEQGVYLGSFLEKKYEDCADAVPRFHYHNRANQSIHILEHEDDCQSLYSFSFNKNNESEFLHWVLNNIYELKNFIEYYKNNTREIISEVKKPENRIVLPLSEKQNSTNTKLHPVKTEILPQKVIHKDSKIPVFLAKQQNTCLVLLMQGKTAKEIARVMNLSYRTVEHYLARIRYLLGCASIKELILAYGNQVVGRAQISN